MKPWKCCVECVPRHWIGALYSMQKPDEQAAFSWLWAAPDQVLSGLEVPWLSPEIAAMANEV